MTAAQRLLKCHPASTGSTGSTGNQQNGLAISYTAHQPCKIHSNGAGNRSMSGPLVLFASLQG